MSPWPLVSQFITWGFALLLASFIVSMITLVALYLLMIVKVVLFG